MVSESTAESVCAHRLHRLVLRFADARSATEQALSGLSWPNPCVLGGGKAGRAMAEAVALHRPGLRGILGVPEAHQGMAGALHLLPTGHPLPTQASVDAVLAQESLVQSTDRPVLFLLSGGATAMLGAPLPGLSLADFAATVQALLASGLDIEQMNTVRRHLTRWGGGKLARRLDRPVLAWVVSDVMDDAPATIGSGPLAADATTYADALAILRLAAERVNIPPAVVAFCEAGMAGRHPETAKIDEPCLAKVEHRILLSNRRVVERLARALAPLPVQVLPQQVGDVEDVAREWGARLGQVPGIFIAGGEPTVRLGKSGFGGRNQHLALSVALRASQPDWLFMSVATDGADGNTPHGGAWVGSAAATRHAARFRETLASYESGAACRDLGLAFTGEPTGTNVADIQIGISGFTHMSAELEHILRGAH